VRAQDPHILKALGRAQAWRRKLESGEMAMAGEIAKAEKVTDRFVSRTMRLAYPCMATSCHYFHRSRRHNQ
jgi:hypothetical protein